MFSTKTNTYIYVEPNDTYIVQNRQSVGMFSSQYSVSRDIPAKHIQSVGMFSTT